MVLLSTVLLEWMGPASKVYQTTTGLEPGEDGGILSRTKHRKPAKFKTRNTRHGSGDKVHRTDNTQNKAGRGDRDREMDETSGPTEEEGVFGCCYMRILEDETPVSPSAPTLFSSRNSSTFCFVLAVSWLPAIRLKI